MNRPVKRRAADGWYQPPGKSLWLPSTIDYETKSKYLLSFTESRGSRTWIPKDSEAFTQREIRVEPYFSIDNFSIIFSQNSKISVYDAIINGKEYCYDLPNFLGMRRDIAVSLNSCMAERKLWFDEYECTVFRGNEVLTPRKASGITFDRIWIIRSLKAETIRIEMRRKSCQIQIEHIKKYFHKDVANMMWEFLDPIIISTIRFNNVDQLY